MELEDIVNIYNKGVWHNFREGMLGIPPPDTGLAP